MKIKLLLAMLSLAMLALISIISFSRANIPLNPMHGYIDFPTSRAYMCSLGKNGNCGAVMVEPQSVESRKGLTRHGPVDDKVASAGHRWFDELDE